MLNLLMKSGDMPKTQNRNDLPRDDPVPTPIITNDEKKKKKSDFAKHGRLRGADKNVLDTFGGNRKSTVPTLTRLKGKMGTQ